MAFDSLDVSPGGDGVPNSSEKSALGASGEPLVSVALPVYNGADYLATSIDAVLAQTYANIELVIADAGSTDDTEQLCRRRANTDPRVRYTRAESYRGITENYQAALEATRGDYVCFVAADDAIASTFIEECMEAHDADGDLVLVFSSTAAIAEDWNQASEAGIDVAYDDDTLDLVSASPSARLTELIRHLHACNAFNGVYRASTIRSTLPFGAFQGWDRVTLAAVVTRGRALQLSDKLQYRRVHNEQVSKGLYGNRADRLFNRTLPSIAYFESINLFFKHIGTVLQAPLSPLDKARCLGVVALRWPLVRRFYWGMEWRSFRERRSEQ